jgi:hypothetical protein
VSLTLCAICEWADARGHELSALTLTFRRPFSGGRSESAPRAQAKPTAAVRTGKPAGQVRSAKAACRPHARRAARATSRAARRQPSLAMEGQRPQAQSDPFISGILLAPPGEGWRQREGRLCEVLWVRDRGRAIRSNWAHSPSPLSLPRRLRAVARRRAREVRVLKSRTGGEGGE